MVGSTKDNDDSKAQSSNTILNNPQLFSLFTSMVNQQVSEQLEKRFVSIRNWLIGTLSVVAIFGAGVVTIAMEHFAEEAVAAELEPTLEEARLALVQSLLESQIAALNLRVLSIDVKDSFREDDAHSIISEIQAIYSEHSDSESRRKLKFAVETAAINFAAVDRPDLVVQLESIARDLLKSSDVIPQSMTLLLGRRLLDDALGPHSWMEPNGEMRETYDKFIQYSYRAKEVGFPEVRLAYVVPLFHLEMRDREQILNLIEDIESLEDADKGGYISIVIEALSQESPQRMAKRMELFLCDYWQESDVLSLIYDQTIIQCETSL